MHSTVNNYIDIVIILSFCRNQEFYMNIDDNINLSQIRMKHKMSSLNALWTKGKFTT